MLTDERVKKIGFSIFTAILLIFFFYIAEMAVGVLYEMQTPKWVKRRLSLALHEHNDKPGISLSRPHPYLTYENTPNYMYKGIRQHNNRGYRNSADIELAKASTSIRILVLGGSTTYGQSVDNPEESWPSLLQNMLNNLLNEEPLKYKVEIINGGIRWGTSAELLNHYLFRDRYLTPDIVILHTGGNDGHPLKYNNYNPEYTHWRSIHGGGENNLRPTEVSLIQASNIIKFIYSIWYSKVSYSPPKAYIHTRGFADLSKADGLENVTKNSAKGFSRNLSLLIRNIKQDGAIPVFFQYYMPGKEIFSEKGKTALKNASVAVNLSIHFEAFQIAYSKNQQVAQTVSKTHDIAYFKINDGEIPIEYFTDNAHLDTRGQQYKAEFMKANIFPYVLKLIQH